jgi:hypothetical protein
MEETTTGAFPGQGQGSGVGVSTGEGAAEEKAAQFGRIARDRVLGAADERKAELASNLEQLAGSLQELSDSSEGPQRQLVDGVARFARKASSTLKRRSSEELLGVAAKEISDRPGVIIAGCFALGFLGARLLKT